MDSNKKNTAGMAAISLLDGFLLNIAMRVKHPSR
jgi:hypothetical protein